MELFFLINIIMTTITGGMLWFLIKKVPYLIVKPSIIFIIFHYVFIQFPAMLYSAYIFNEISKYMNYFILSQIFPIVIIGISFFTFSKNARMVWERVQAELFQFNEKIAWIYLIIVGVIVGIYLSYVGITNTGIYAILFKPENAAMARENSLKLLNSQIVVYLYTILCSGIVPVLAGMGSLQMAFAFRNKNYYQFFCMVIVLLICFVSISFPGHRSGSISIMLTIIMSFAYIKKFENFSINKILKIAGLLFIIMAFITFKREGIDIFNTNIFEYLFSMDSDKKGLVRGIIYRVFFIPMKTGIDYVSYADQFGYWGIAAIPKLAWLVGIEPINVSNIMFKIVHNSLNPQESGTYPTGFLFSYYAYFGMWTVFPSMLLVLSLDVLVVSYRWMGNGLLVPLLGAVFVAISKLVGANFTTALITHGILSSVVIVILIQLLSQRLLRNRKSPDSCYTKKA